MWPKSCNVICEWPPTARQCRSETKQNIFEEFLSSAFPQVKKYHLLEI